MFHVNMFHVNMFHVNMFHLGDEDQKLCQTYTNTTCVVSFRWRPLESKHVSSDTSVIQGGVESLDAISLKVIFRKRAL